MGPVNYGEAIKSNQRIIAAGNELDSIQRQIEAAEKDGNNSRVAELKRQLEGKKGIVRSDQPYF
ncbi:MAG: hypothetical protein Athens071425_101 [Parcubacteria group bacterium Athens0714_25]|nr:MAG: hypothetical protein Athens071425_101 [Parcubacteria group bacterium Athens0714_25]